ncbi:MAG: hypothetical protein M3220_21420, partial [Chloroflexota bacterium]|nr:hypothetical protein [Chloroflexota bacterium]
HFIFEAGNDGTSNRLFLGRVGAEAVPLFDTGEMVIDLRWVDESHFLFLSGGFNDWELRLGALDGSSILLAEIAGPPTPYDFSKSVSPSASALSADVTEIVATDILATNSDYTLAPLPLQNNVDDRPLWAVFSTGDATEISQEHFVAVYTQTPDGWQELDRVILPRAIVLAADAVTQVELAAGNLWLAVRGSSALVGSCCYDLLRFDGTTLQNALSYEARSIEHIETRIAQDGTPEVMITVQPWGGANAPTPPPDTTTFYWTGEQFVER